MSVPLHLHNVYKSFGEKKVLQGVSAKVAQGESLVVIGGSGTGKSVLVRCILGLLTPEKGDIWINGQSVINISRSEHASQMKGIGMMFQGSALFDSLSVWENVAFGLIHVHGMNRRDAKAIALEKLAAVGLNSDVAELFPAEISGGMQRRVALARAVASNPKILFFDEPTAGLDPIFSGVISLLIRNCVTQLGATALTITHDMHCARKVADNIAMIYQGEFVWYGKGSELNTTKNPYIRQFVHGDTTGPIQLDTHERAF